MRVPFVEYLLALSSAGGLGYSVSGPPSVEAQRELEVASFQLGVTDVTVSAIPRCWALSSTVSASYGPLHHL